MNTKNITLKVNSKLYEDYRQYCKKKGLVVSRQFELLMEDTLNNIQKDGKDE